MTSFHRKIFWDFFALIGIFMRNSDITTHLSSPWSSLVDGVGYASREPLQKGTTQSQIGHFVKIENTVSVIEAADPI
jgi:hypothetical protein